MPSRSEAGFTLMEMLVALTVLALATGLVAASFGTAGGPAALAADARALLGAARMARQQAILEERETLLLLDLAGRRWTMGEASGRWSDKTALTVTADREETGTDRAAVRFLPDGGSSGAVIELAAGGARRTVRIDWLTGHARLD